MNRKTTFRLLLINIFLFGYLATNAQDPNRFKEQVNRISNKEYKLNPDKKLAVFTGSSSVVMWKDVQDYYPEYNVINKGFGGSHFSDLIYFYDEIITTHSPEILFIYEGDNDISSNKKPNKILKEAKGLLARIQKDLPETKLVLISPKPSIARWNMKKDYNKLNKKLKKYCNKTDNLEFADVWNIMLDENGMVYKDVFIQDGLHMNKKGYDLWDKVIGEYLK